MNVVVTIPPGGREAIPVRALPYVSPSALDPLSPARIASDLAEPLDGPFEHESPDVGRRVLTGLRAFLLDAQGEPAEVLPGMWAIVAADIEAQQKEDRPFDPAYRREIKLLPRGVFVWKSEFEEAFENIRKGHRRLSYETLIPEEMSEVVMDGFHRDASAPNNPATSDRDKPDQATNLVGCMPSLATTPAGRSRSVIVSIPNNDSLREAIPVRAISFMLNWKHPITVVGELANISDTDLPISQHVFARCWNDRGAIVEVPSCYWKSLRGTQQSKPKEDLSLLDKIRALPSGVFLWRDEFEKAFTRVLNSYPPPRLPLRPSGFDFIFAPRIEDVLMESIMEGFEHFIDTPMAPPEQAAQSSVSANELRGDQEAPLIERRIAAIMKAVEAENYPALAIPRGGKAAIEQRCLMSAGLFTKATFPKAWQEAVRRGVIAIKDAAKYRPKR